MATEPVENELDCVLEDVWIEVLLPLLSIRDIFQLCAVNRHIRDLLLKECIFRRLCQQRYQLSPSLNTSYISAAKNMYISICVVSMDSNLIWDNYRLATSDLSEQDLLTYASQRNILQRRSRLPAQQLSLARTLLDTPRLATQRLLVQDQKLTIEDVSAQLTPVFGGTLNKVTKTLHERFDSHEEYQQDLLNKLEQDVPKLVPYLPLAYRSRRLIELAHCFHCIIARDPTMFSRFQQDMSNLPGRPVQTFTWAHQHALYDLHWKPVYELGSAAPAAGMLWTRIFIDAIAQLSGDYSVIRLLITGKLRTSQTNDYFNAVTEYNNIWKDLPEATRPNLQVIHHELGTFLLSSTSALHSRNEFTKMELVNAMEMIGNNLVDEATRKSDTTLTTQRLIS
ncbi:uncharacterized protein LOC135813012 [Sycon ciliatum]|uniref:uncharacterized protein LOC135813012 n=1 Tax=Sycon ciliatum TaxID=27933 RepID=UPI0031F68FEA